MPHLPTRMRSAVVSARAALLVAAGLLVAGSSPAHAMLLPRDPAKLAAAVAAQYEGADWPADEQPPGLTQEETRLLRMLLQRMIQEKRDHQLDEHDAAIDAALEAVGPLLEASDMAAGGEAGHPPPHAPDDKRNFRALVPTLCHFKICNMGRKRNSPDAPAAAPWTSL